MAFFKGLSDLDEILAIDKERFIGLPDSFSFFHNCAMLQNSVLSRIISSGIGQMERGIFIVIDAD